MPVKPSSVSSSVAQAMPWPALIPLGSHMGKPPIPLSRPLMLVGSKPNCHLNLQSHQVSRAHALFLTSDNRVYIRDLASRTHVYVNGQELREAYLEDGDLLKIGSFTFKFQAPAGGIARGPYPNPAPAMLVVEGADAPLRLDQRVLLIGRKPTNDLSLIEDTASTAHAVIVSMNGKHFIRDLGSRTGTYVNRTPNKQVELSFGDQILIGETIMRYEAASGLPTQREEIDELEHLVGTAPLVEEPADIITGSRVAGPADDHRAGQVAAGHEAPTAPAPPPVDLAADMAMVDYNHSAHDTALLPAEDDATASASTSELRSPVEDRAPIIPDSPPIDAAADAIESSDAGPIPMAPEPVEEPPAEEAHHDGAAAGVASPVWSSEPIPLAGPEPVEDTLEGPASVSAEPAPVAEDELHGGAVESQHIPVFEPETPAGEQMDLTVGVNDADTLPPPDVELPLPLELDTGAAGTRAAETVADADLLSAFDELPPIEEIADGHPAVVEAQRPPIIEPEPVIEQAPEVVSEEPLPEPSREADLTAAIDEAPLDEPEVEAAPVAEETPIVEETPEADLLAVVEPIEPPVEEAPEAVAELAPIIEEEPVAEAAPVAESTPIVEEPIVVEPVVEGATVVEQTPEIVVEEPVAEAAPVVESAVEPVVEQAVHAPTEEPVAEAEATIEAAPEIAAEEPAAEATPEADLIADIEEEPLAEPVVEAEATVEAAPEIAAEAPAAEATLETDLIADIEEEPLAEPVVETEATVEATPEITAEEPVVESAPLVESATVEPVAEAEPVVEQTVETPTEEPAVESAPLAESSAVEPVAEAEPVVEQTVEAPTEEPAAEAEATVDVTPEIAPEAPAAEATPEANLIADIEEEPLAEPVVEAEAAIEAAPEITIAEPVAESAPMVESPVVEPVAEVEPVVEQTVEAPAEEPVAEAVAEVEAAPEIAAIEEEPLAESVVEAEAAAEATPEITAEEPLAEATPEVDLIAAIDEEPLAEPVVEAEATVEASPEIAPEEPAAEAEPVVEQAVETPAEEPVVEAAAGVEAAPEIAAVEEEPLAEPVVEAEATVESAPEIAAEEPLAEATPEADLAAAVEEEPVAEVAPEVTSEEPLAEATPEADLAFSLGDLAADADTQTQEETPDQSSAAELEPPPVEEAESEQEPEITAEVAAAESPAEEPVAEEPLAEATPDVELFVPLDELDQGAQPPPDRDVSDAELQSMLDDLTEVVAAEASALGVDLTTDEPPIDLFGTSSVASSPADENGKNGSGSVMQPGKPADPDKTGDTTGVPSGDAPVAAATKAPPAEPPLSEVAKEAPVASGSGKGQHDQGTRASGGSATAGRNLGASPPAKDDQADQIEAQLLAELGGGLETGDQSAPAPATSPFDDIAGGDADALESTEIEVPALDEQPTAEDESWAGDAAAGVSEDQSEQDLSPIGPAAQDHVGDAVVEPVAEEEPSEEEPSDASGDIAAQDHVGDASLEPAVDEAPDTEIAATEAGEAEAVETEAAEAATVEAETESVAEPPPGPMTAAELAGAIAADVNAGAATDAAAETDDSADDLADVIDETDSWMPPAAPNIEGDAYAATPLTLEPPAPGESESTSGIQGPAAVVSEVPPVVEAAPHVGLSSPELLAPVVPPATPSPVAAIAPPADALPPVEEELPPPATSRQEPHPPLNTAEGMPYFDMGAAGFLGGMPLRLNDLPTPPPAFGKVAVKFGEEQQDRPPQKPAGKQPGPYDQVRIKDEDVERAPLGDMPLTGETDDEAILTSSARNLLPKRAVPPPSKRQRPRPTGGAKPIDPSAASRGFGGSPANPAAPSDPYADAAFGMPESLSGGGLGGGIADAPVDVFGGLSPAPAADPFLGRGSAPRKGGAGAVRRPPRSTPREAPPAETSYDEPSQESEDGALLAEQTTVPTARAGQTPRASAVPARTGEAARRAPGVRPTAFSPPPMGPPRRRGRKKLWLLLLLMLVLMAGAVAAVYYLPHFMHRQPAEGAVTFQNTRLLNRHEMDVLQDKLTQTLQSDSTARAAQVEFARRRPGVPVGFLASAEEMARNLHFRWGGPKGNVLTLRYDGVDAQDAVRLDALLAAFYDANRPLINAANDAAAKLEQLKEVIAQSDRKLADLTREWEQSNRLLENAQPVERLAALQRDADQQWAIVQAARKEASALSDETVRLERQIQELTAAPSASPAVSPTTQAAASQPGGNANDPDMVALQQLNQRLEAAKNFASDRMAQARKGVEDALLKLQEGEGVAPGQVGVNPQVTAFLVVTQELQEQSRALTSDLLDRHRKSHERLVELKKRLDEKIEAKKQELYANDRELKRLQDDLAMRQRGYNAAIDEKYEKEAAEIKKQMEAVRWQIEVRKKDIAQDILFNGFSAEIEQDIVASQRQLDDLRKSTDKLSKNVESAVARGTAALENLPATQKARLASNLEAVDAAVKQYNAVMDTVGGEGSQQIRQIESQARELTRRIDARRLRKLVDQKREELARKNKIVDDAAEVFARKDRARLEAAELDRIAHIDRQRAFDAKEKMRTAKQELDALNRQLQNKTTEADKAPYPLPIETECRSLGGPDMRPLYAGGGASAVALLFTFIIVLAAGGGSPADRAAPGADAYVQEDEVSEPGSPDDDPLAEPDHTDADSSAGKVTV